MNFKEEFEKLKSLWGRDLFSGIDSLAERVVEGNHLEDFQKYYAEKDRSGDDRLHRVLFKIIDETPNNQELIYWAGTFEDAWRAFLYINKRIECQFEDNENILHLLSRNTEIDYENVADRLLPFFQMNIRLFFRENDHGKAPCDLLKENQAYQPGKKFHIKRIFEAYAEYDPVLSHKWDQNWNLLLSVNSPELIQRALKENPALILSYASEVGEKNKTLLEAVDEKHQEFLAKQLLVKLCKVISSDELNEDERFDRKKEIERNLINWCFVGGDPIGKLKTLTNYVYHEDKNINQGVIKAAVFNLKTSFANNTAAEKANELKVKAIVATALSVLLIGIPYAIYYWSQFQKVTKSSPVHVFQMPASTYAKLSSKLEVDKNGKIEVHDDVDIFDNENNLKRVVNVEKKGASSPLFLANDIKKNSRLRIVCSDGEQAEKLRKKIDTLNPFERLTVQTIL